LIPQIHERIWCQQWLMIIVIIHECWSTRCCHLFNSWSKTILSQMFSFINHRLSGHWRLNNVHLFLDWIKIHLLVWLIHVSCHFKSFVSLLNYSVFFTCDCYHWIIVRDWCWLWLFHQTFKINLPVSITFLAGWMIITNLFA
jgi:hypothetical protein